jgi:hypothetical protein
MMVLETEEEPRLDVLTNPLLQESFNLDAFATTEDMKEENYETHQAEESSKPLETEEHIVNTATKQHKSAFSLDFKLGETI